MSGCKERVYGSGRYAGFHGSTCTKPAVAGTNYCKIHSPEYVAAKRQKRDEEYDAKNKAIQAERQLRISAKKTVVEAAEVMHTERCSTGDGTVDCSCELAKAIRVMYRIPLVDPSNDR